MKKKIVCLAMIAIMALGVPMTANAEVIKGSEDWSITYEKNGISSNFKGSSATEDVLENLQPGDSIQLQIKLENDSAKQSDWYMANEVLQSLEDGSGASGGAYTYVLTYTNPKGEVDTIYSNERVGGEAPKARSGGGAGVGLNQATNMLDEHFYLDRLSAGDVAYIKLMIALDGETQGNDYQQTLAKLQMDFAVEQVNEVTHELVEEILQRKVVTTSRPGVKTGDASQIALMSGLALVSGVALAGVALKQVKGRKKGE